MHRLWQGAMAIATGGFGVSCSTSRTSMTTEADTSPINRQLFGSPKEQAAARRLRTDTFIRCMNKAGFRYFPELPFVAPRLDGYGVTGIPPRAQAGPNEKYVSGLNTETTAAYSQNFQLCITRTADVVARKQPNYERVPALLDLKKIADRQILTDPLVVRGTRKWSACMRNAGWEFLDPTEPSRELIAQFNSLDPLQQAGTPQIGSVPISHTDPTITKAVNIALLRDAETRIYRKDKECATRWLDHVTAAARERIERGLLAGSK